jgi:sugar (pentulose or hexulose) kinase
MFPIDPSAGTYYTGMISAFDQHIAPRKYPWTLTEVLPEVVRVGDVAGTLSAAGAQLLDETGVLQSGIPLCPPEGDAGTGMVATNSVRVRTGNVSAGTSVFAMVVLENELSQIHPQIDRVVTPDSKLVAMAHSNNCTSDFDALMAVFGEVSRVMGGSDDLGEVYSRIMPLALHGDADAGGLVAYGYLSGEHMTGFTEGRPLFVRRPDSSFTLANVIRVHLFTALGALRTGLNILMEEEGVPIEELRGHGGFFKTPEVGQRIMAMATETPVSVLETAGEGGAWGMALLAAFMKRQDRSQDLPAFLDRIFVSGQGTAYVPDQEEVAGFRAFFARYTAGLAVERAAVEAL